MYKGWIIFVHKTFYKLHDSKKSKGCTYGLCYLAKRMNTLLDKERFIYKS